MKEFVMVSTVGIKNASAKTAQIMKIAARPKSFFLHPSTSFPKLSSTLKRTAMIITMTMAIITAAEESF